MAKYKAGKCGVINRLETLGKFSLYHRDWNEPGLLHYVIFDDETNKGEAEFRTYAAAFDWLRQLQPKLVQEDGWKSDGRLVY